MCPTYISTLFEQPAIKLVEFGYSEIMIAEFILSIKYAVMTSLHPDKLSRCHVKCEFVSDQPFADISQVFIQTGLNDIHIFIRVGKMRVIGIHSRTRVS